MIQVKDITGERFGKLVVVRCVSDVKKRHGTWECVCDCGGTVECSGAAVRYGDRVSCGCMRRATIERWRTMALKHGAKATGKVAPEYRAWQHMKSRCFNPNDRNYAGYGGRGITVCPEWRDDFQAFASHVGQRPSPMHSIDRIDVNGHYEPGNVRWATGSEQMRNTRRTRNVQWRGETRCMTEWAERVGIDESALRYRINAGWTEDAAIGTPSGAWRARAKNRVRPPTRGAGGFGSTGVK